MKRIANKEARYYVETLQEFKGSNLSGVKQGNKYVVYSYNWYPLLIMHDGQWYENGDKYSASTSKQLHYARPSRETKTLSNAGMIDLLSCKD